MLKRYCPEKPLPPYAFIPGMNPHPFKEQGHWQGQHEPICEMITDTSPLTNRDFAYALDLYNHQFYWEAHVYLEALWNAHKRIGPIATLLKAIIIDSAGMIKMKKGQSRPAETHFNRAHELLDSLLNHKTLIGIDLVELSRAWKSGERQILIN